MVDADQVFWPGLAIYTEWWSRYVVKRGIGIETFALEVSRRGRDLLSTQCLDQWSGKIDQRAGAQMLVLGIC
jgi:hypothetical protein